MTHSLAVVDLELANGFLVVRDHATRREISRFSEALAQRCVAMKLSLHATDLEDRLLELTPERMRIAMEGVLVVSYDGGK